VVIAPLLSSSFFRSYVESVQMRKRQLAAFQNTRVRPIGRDMAGMLNWLFSDWLWKVTASRATARKMRTH
jgi:hypothetical protein